MSEPDEIVADALAAVGPHDLIGRRILVTAGGTRDPLDPVRYIGNRSSGRQGVAIARAVDRQYRGGIGRYPIDGARAEMRIEGVHAIAAEQRRQRYRRIAATFVGAPQV